MLKERNGDASSVIFTWGVSRVIFLTYLSAVLPRDRNDNIDALSHASCFTEPNSKCIIDCLLPLSYASRHGLIFLHAGATMSIVCFCFVFCFVLFLSFTVSG